jgi:hypothetical protein
LLRAEGELAPRNTQPFLTCRELDFPADEGSFGSVHAGRFGLKPRCSFGGSGLDARTPRVDHAGVAVTFGLGCAGLAFLPNP